MFTTAACPSSSLASLGAVGPLARVAGRKPPSGPAGRGEQGPVRASAAAPGRRRTANLGFQDEPRRDPKDAALAMAAAMAVLGNPGPCQEATARDIENRPLVQLPQVAMINPMAQFLQSAAQHQLMQTFQQPASPEAEAQVPADMPLEQPVQAERPLLADLPPALAAELASLLQEADDLLAMPSPDEVQIPLATATAIAEGPKPAAPAEVVDPAVLQQRLTEDLKEDQEEIANAVVEAERLQDEAADLAAATGDAAAASDPGSALLAARAGVVELRGEIDAVLEGLRRAEASDKRLGEDLSALFARLEEQESRSAMVEAALSDVQREAAIATAQGEEVARLEKRVASKDEEIKALQATIKDRDGQISALTSEIGSLQEQMGDGGVTADMEEAFLELDRMRGQLEDLSAAQAAVELRDKEIASLNSLVSGLEDAVKAKEAQRVAAVDQRAAALEQASKSAKMADRAEELRKQTLQAEVVLAARDRDIERLRKAVVDRDGRLAQSVALVREMREFVREKCQ